MTRLECLKTTARRLKSVTREAEAEARYMLAYLFQCEFSDLYLQGAVELTDQETEALESLVEQRKTGMPLAYVLKERWFMGMPFLVTPDVLIPRQDTELLVETGLGLIEKNCLETVLELCTGSGCVAVSVAKLSGKKVEALDISQAALRVAKENAQKNNADVAFFASDLFENVKKRYDLILANPPYISREEYAELAPEVREYEPKLALFTETGLEFYQKIVNNIDQYLTRGGWLAVEIGYEQGECVSLLMEAAGLTNVQIKKDLAGYDRVVLGQQKKFGEESNV